MIHLEGLGVVGSILAWHLHLRRVPFTWHDVDAPVTAWRACTGVVYPSGDPFDQANYDVWSLWAKEPPWSVGIGPCVETTGWWYCTKSPPHGAKYRAADVGVLHRAPLAAYHLNAQRFVPASQHYFAAMRVPKPKATADRVVTHGFGARLDHVLWGWTVRVRIALDERMRAVESYPRASVYMRQGRFVMAYAYAVPGERWWYAGSSLIVQRHVHRSLAIEPKYERWKCDFERLAGGMVKVVERGEATEGWRPAAAKGDGALVRRVDGALHLKPLWSSGVRHSPLVVEAALKELGA